MVVPCLVKLFSVIHTSFCKYECIIPHHLGMIWVSNKLGRVRLCVFISLFIYTVIFCQKLVFCLEINIYKLYFTFYSNI